MLRTQLLLLLLAGVSLAATGCGRAVGRQVEQQPPAPLDQRANADAGNDDEDVRTPLIRALLDKLDELDVPEEFADDGVDKEMLRDILLAADDELADNTGDELKAKILRANQRRPALIVRPQRFIEPVEEDVAPEPPTAEVLPPKRDEAG